MIDLISSKLKETGLPVLWQLRPKDFPSLSFFFVDEYGEVFAEDKEIETAYMLQVDIWSKNNYTAIVEQVKAKLAEIGLHRQAAYDDYESDTGVYHKTLRFPILRGIESEA